MATITLTNTDLASGYSMSVDDIVAIIGLVSSTVADYSPTQVSYDDGLVSFVVNGTFSSPDENGDPTQGSITSFTLTIGDGVNSRTMTATGLNLSVPTIYGLIAGNNPSTLYATVFSGHDTINGTAQADDLFGLGGNDTLNGNAGDDSLDGAGGNDAIYGGAGLDFIDGSSGVDTLYGGDDNDDIEGGSGNDFLYGDGGADTIDGEGGDDTMTGGDGDDSFFVDSINDVAIEAAAGGVDRIVTSVNYTLSANIENLLLLGTANLNGTGNGLANAITGNDGANVLDGGAGADTMTGGKGNDTYIVDNAGDVVVEVSAASGGLDTVQASVSYAISTGVETLQLAGSAAINATGSIRADILIGNSGDNTMSGDAGVDTVSGGGGNDTISGGDGADILQGGDGAKDIVSYEASLVGVTVDLSTNTASGGQADGDTISGFEGATGSDFVDALTGDGGDNWLFGRAGADTLTGNEGNDHLNGGVGADSLDGGDGADTAGYDFAATGVVANLSSPGLNTGEATGDSYVSIENLTGSAFADALKGNAGANVLDGGADADTMTGGAGNDTYVVDNAGDVVNEASSTYGIDQVNASIDYTLGARVENLLLLGAADIDGEGNALNNTITGNSGANVIDGQSGADTMLGGDGNDTYNVDNAGDVVIETSAVGGIDLVNAYVNYALDANLEKLTLRGTANLNGTGNGLNNTLVGNSGANLLDGGAGADTMSGGAGNDTYVVDDAGDVVNEASSTYGIDQVNASIDYTLAIRVEKLTLLGTDNLNGTGNTLANTITGNSGNNTLDGAGGADTMSGGDGNDTYVVDNTGDVVIETAVGTDQVDAWVNFGLSANVENLTLRGTANLNGTGNGLNNTLTGNSGANLLDGGAGADTMKGGAGNDTYVVDNVGDVVNEASTTYGIDQVNASIDYTLAARVENLLLLGTGDIDGTGNTLANTITGNSGANTLNGDLGLDTLIGGGGDDLFVFGTPLSAANRDTIADFTTGADQLHLDGDVFAALTGPGMLAADAFHTGSAAHDADDRVIYDSATGALYYDADGTGSGAAVQFATLTPAFSLSNTDIFVI